MPEIILKFPVPLTVTDALIWTFPEVVKDCIDGDAARFMIGLTAVPPVVIFEPGPTPIIAPEPPDPIAENIL